MNGRHITGWGVKSAHGVSGIVSRALYQPTERRYGTGSSAVRADGIEARSFHIVPNGHSQPLASDGSLIEINVFRAKGRRRRVPNLDQFRDQGQYGIR